MDLVCDPVNAHNWLSLNTAVITPVLGTSKVEIPGDPRPISVTPLLSRIVERLGVKAHIFLYVSDTQDQFKPVCNTNLAKINISHTVSTMLVEKLKKYAINDHTINWVVSFLTKMSQYTKIGKNCSILLAVGRSIVQGSGLVRV